MPRKKPAPQLGKTLEVAVAAAKRHAGEELIKPGEVVWGKPVAPKRGEAERRIGLFAAKCFNLMLGVVQEAGFDDQQYAIPKATLRRAHKGNDRLSDMRKELHTVAYEFRVLSPRGKPGTLIASLLSSSIEEDDESTDGMFYFRLDPNLAKALKQSPTWSSLLASHVVKFDSGYALKLYEIGCQMVGRDFACNLDLSPDELRELLHVPSGVYRDWTSLREKTIEVAMREVNQIAQSFTVSMPPELIRRAGRKVTRVTLVFTGTNPAKALLAREEVESHSAGRKARRAGTVETVVDRTTLSKAENWLRSVTPSAREPWAERAIKLGARDMGAGMVASTSLKSWLDFVAAEIVAAEKL